LLTAQELQQHRHPLVGGLAFVQRQVLAERAGDDADAITTLSLGGSGSSISPSRSRERISLMTSSGTRAGPTPSMMRLNTPGHHLAACHCRTISTKQ
jgi:hypothetical protein